MTNRLQTVALLALTLLTQNTLAQQHLPAKVDIAWNRFYDSSEVVSIIQKLAGAYPNLLTVEEIGKSVQGRPLLVVTMNNANTGAADTKPAMWIDGNIHGNEIQATETVLYSIDYLCRAYGTVPSLTELIDQSTFYFLASVNPDGRANWFSQQNNPHSSRTGMQPTDDDRDGSADEDGPDDLDGDGSIGQMWRKDALGTHRRSVRDPRILERVAREPRPDGTIEYGDWSHGGSEGVDNDGDGRINEDGPGGYDMNRNWPGDWQPDHVQNGAGDYPLCFPETRAIAAWVLKHPNIAAAQSYHNAGGMILRGPGADYREGDYSSEDRATYDAISGAGAEMLPHYRPMVIFKELYTVHGGFVNWLAESLGIISFTNELWTDNRILQNGREPTQDEMVRWRDRVLFGQTTSDWKELNHPEYGAVLVGGANKWSSRIPPPFMIEEELHRNFAFTVFHAQQMPRLAFASVTIESLGQQLWQVTVAISNEHRIPTRTVRASQKKIGLPDHLTLSGLALTVASGGPMAQRLATTFQPARKNPHDLSVEGGIGGLSTNAYRFIVQAPEGTRATLRYAGEKFKAIEQTFTITAPK